MVWVGGRHPPERGTMPSLTTAHVTRVTTSRNDHGYPFNAVCSCGYTSWGYVRAHAAEIMADDHRTTIAKEA